MYRYNPTINRISNDIYPGPNLKNGFNEIKDKELLNEYFNCLENISNGLSYICEIGDRKPNIVGKFMLKIKGLRLKDKETLIENIKEYNNIEDKIEKYIYNSKNGLYECAENFQRIKELINEVEKMFGIKK